MLNSSSKRYSPQHPSSDSEEFDQFEQEETCTPGTDGTSYPSQSWSLECRTRSTVGARVWPIGSTLNCASLTLGCCASMATAIARKRNAMMVRFMVGLLFVEKLQHVVSRFFAVHDGKLAHDVLFRGGVFLVAGQGYKVVGVAADKQGVGY